MHPPRQIISPVSAAQKRFTNTFFEELQLLIVHGKRCSGQLLSVTRQVHRTSLSESAALPHPSPEPRGHCDAGRDACATLRPTEYTREAYATLPENALSAPGGIAQRRAPTSAFRLFTSYFNPALAAWSIWSCSASCTPSSKSLALSLLPSSSSSSLQASGTLCPVDPYTGSHRSDSGTDSRRAISGSIPGSPVNSRLAWSQSDFDTLCAERPLMTASSRARSCTISGVTVPMPAEFSIKAPSFSGFVFIGRLSH